MDGQEIQDWPNGSRSVQHDGVITVSTKMTRSTTEIYLVTEGAAVLRTTSLSRYGIKTRPDVTWRVVTPDGPEHGAAEPTRKDALTRVGA